MSTDDPAGPVLVTGGTGFIAAHCIAEALRAGSPVRTTVRSLASAKKVRGLVDAAGQDGASVEVLTADLTADDGWSEAMQGVRGVLHVASPVPHGEPRDPEDVIRPARDGALRVLRHARDASAERVVMTSAFGAVGFGHGPTDHHFSEEDWSVLDGPGMSTYNRSKTLAEQAAWQWAREEGAGLELVALCPTAVFGSVLSTSVSGGNEVIRRLLIGQMPGTLDLWFPVVDVRDVAAAHVAALEVPSAAGKRIIVGSGEGMTMAQIAAALREDLGADARKVPTRAIPTWLVRAIARVYRPARDFAAELGTSKIIDTSRMREILDISPRPAREAVLDSARSMITRGII